MTFRRSLCILLLAALLAGLWGCGLSAEEAGYRQGRSALSSGRLAEAAGFFGPLGEYKDAHRQMQTIYEEALALYETQAYIQAAEAFRVLAEYEIRDARDYAAASHALVCLNALDGSGARAALAEGDPTSQPIRDAAAQADTLLFPGTSVFRPEYAARELMSGELSARIRQEALDGNLKYLYAMDRRESERLYQQYREYCIAAFPDTFRDESGNYFSFRADGVLCYVSNFHSVDGGVVILISAL